MSSLHTSAAASGATHRVVVGRVISGAASVAAAAAAPSAYDVRGASLPGTGRLVCSSAAAAGPAAAGATPDSCRAFCTTLLPAQTRHLQARHGGLRPAAGPGGVRAANAGPIWCGGGGGSGRLGALDQLLQGGCLLHANRQLARAGRGRQQLPQAQQGRHRCCRCWCHRPRE